MAPSSRSLLAAAAICLSSFFASSLVSAHTVITYPGWRGDNLHTNGSVEDTDGLGVGSNNSYPYGMQWMYPCGGMPLSTNRTLWPLTGGAIAIQPGWFQGHATAFFYINLGDGTLPPNMSLPMVPVFQITGPTRLPYPGTFCLPQVPLPANYTAVKGGNATIQVVESAVHGAALYNCVDITFADPKDVPEVNSSNCFNSSQIGFNLVFSTTSLSGADALFSRSATWLAAIPAVMTLVWGLL
ncbi:MAG: hypothetical protein FRX48_02051 [Lasallia pustulata]|uniref:Copper acquisition factor BIM1-like domain-containing protein n=1 Tax=Lasallia pustulata TaxID=136370 RepID=A0A5M8PYC1_9LECA|nr:MAG: hypothetical protein FRX48_02051 [Lasallia pustulata]